MYISNKIFKLFSVSLLFLFFFSYLQAEEKITHNTEQIDEKIRASLSGFDQEHFINKSLSFSLEEKKILLSDLQSFDPDFSEEQKNCFIRDGKKYGKNDLEPLTEYIEDAYGYKDIGTTILSSGQFACVMLAGGQASRLNVEEPKGFFPVSVVLKKSLFQIFAEKILSAQKKYNIEFPIAIMTSPLNYQQTITFFKKHNFFGLKRDLVHFFSQEMIPVLDENKQWLWEEERKIACGPNGNGSFYNSLLKNQILKKFQDKNIKYLSVFAVDNPLIDPFDEEMAGYHVSQNHEVTIKAIKKEKDQDRMGILAKDQGVIRIVEACNVDPSLLYAKNEDNSLVFPLANTGFFICNLDFATNIAKNITLPLHPVWKNIPSIKKMGWKCEKFILDAFIYSKKTGVVVSEQKNCFAPLKNFEGNDSIATVAQKILDRDRVVLKTLLNKDMSDSIFELSQDFYYPTKDFLEKCQTEEYNNFISYPEDIGR